MSGAPVHKNLFANETMKKSSRITIERMAKRSKLIKLQIYSSLRWALVDVLLTTETVLTRIALNEIE